MDQETTQEEIQKIREEEAAAVFEGKATPAEEQPPEEPEGEKVVDNEEPAGDEIEGGAGDEKDPWEGVPEPVKQKYEEMESRIKGMDDLTNRLKQAESRVGAMQNAFYKREKEREEAKKRKAKEPTPEEVAAEQKAKEKWDSLKEDPDSEAVVKAIDDQLGLKTGKLEKELTDLKGAITQLSEITRTPANANEVAELKDTIETMKVGLAHKGWQKTVQSDEYKEWLTTAPAELRAKTASSKGHDAIDVLDAFEDYKKKQKPTQTAEEIKAERENRLKRSSEKPKPRDSKPAKDEKDMTDAEFRRKAAREIFG